VLGCVGKNLNAQRPPAGDVVHAQSHAGVDALSQMTAEHLHRLLPVQQQVLGADHAELSVCHGVRSRGGKDRLAGQHDRLVGRCVQHHVAQVPGRGGVRCPVDLVEYQQDLARKQ
jgi:hypothetical protein